MFKRLILTTALLFMFVSTVSAWTVPQMRPYPDHWTVVNGSAALPAIAFGDGNTGFYETTDNTVNIVSNGAIVGGISPTGINAGTPSAISAVPYMVTEAATATNPVFTFGDDLNTGIGTSGADAVSLIAGGVEGMRITEATTITTTMAGIVGVGTTTMTPDVRFAQALDVTSSADLGGMSLSNWSATNTDTNLLDLKKSGSDTIGTHVVVTDNELIGIIAFRGSDGVEFLNAAFIQGEIDGTLTGGGTDDMPGMLSFWTTPDGTGNSLQRMTIDSNGDVGIGVITPDETLEVAGHYKASGTAPTFSGDVCGTSPSASGADSAGKITVGTTATTSCAMTFNAAFQQAPSCVVTGDIDGTEYAATTTTSILTITSATDMDSDVIMYICFGQGA